MRASRADREQVIELLKAAFVQDRLTQDELETRVGLALASRTYAELAGLTADIPAGSAAVEPATPPARILARAARRSGVCMLVALAMVGVIALTNAQNLVGLAFFLVVAASVAASGFLGYGVVDAWQQRRSRGQLPPRPGHGTQAPEVTQPSRDRPHSPGAASQDTARRTTSTRRRVTRRPMSKLTGRLSYG